jgi:hypothetical protein
MGEAKARSRSRKSILAAESRCVYCAGEPTTLEHMPPRSMFRRSRRPSGLEFANCATCNGGTSGADVVGSFFARMGPDDDAEHWQVQDILNLRASLERRAPGVAHEIFREEKSKQVLRRSAGGILLPAVEIHADGPLLRSYMAVFASKLGMAFYREHVGQPLPLEGAVYSHWYLNAGLGQDAADAMLRKLPLGAGLRQGKFQVHDQFAYRFNCDNRTILAALAQLGADPLRRRGPE